MLNWTLKTACWLDSIATVTVIAFCDQILKNYFLFNSFIFKAVTMIIKITIDEFLFNS
jgi:hypothetical protein